MEERTPPAADRNHLNDFPQPQSETSHPAFRSGTYVVQVPKDQIYRFPPPEHALLAEHRGNPARQTRSCCSLLCLIIIVSVIVLILGLIGGVTSIFLDHNNPTFHIEHVLVKKPPLHHPRENPEYDISLKADNTNDHERIFYDQGGEATFSFRKQEIAGGTYPIFHQGPKNSTVFRMVLHGSKNGLPREIEKSMESQKLKLNISLSLLMNVPIRLKIGALKTGSRKIVVSCNMTIDTLAKNSHLLSENCHTGS